MIVSLSISILTIICSKTLTKTRYRTSNVDTALDEHSSFLPYNPLKSYRDPSNIHRPREENAWL